MTQQLLIGGIEPSVAPSPTRVNQTALDERCLEGLAVMRLDAAALVNEIITCDLRRDELEIELVRRKEKLEDPDLWDHPLRPNAVRVYDEREAEATLIPFTRNRLTSDIRYVIEKAARMIARLSPAAHDECVPLWGDVFCANPDPANGWSVIGYPIETPAWRRRNPGPAPVAKRSGGIEG